MPSVGEGLSFDAAIWSMHAQQLQSPAVTVLLCSRLLTLSVLSRRARTTPRLAHVLLSRWLLKYNCCIGIFTSEVLSMLRASMMPRYVELLLEKLL